MIRGTVDVKLRPIKIAFLVHPDDKNSLLKAIEINTLLWGGIYNPIIPIYEEKPRTWEDSSSKSSNFQDIIFGYLNNFDPDYIISMGECSDYPFHLGYRKKIADISKIIGSFEEHRTPNYGISIFEVLDYFCKVELKSPQRYTQDVYLPQFDSRSQLFLSSVFGTLSDNFRTVFWEDFKHALDAKEMDCPAPNYVEFLNPQTLFLARMTSLYIEVRNYRERGIFFLDEDSGLDIMDYWNLRAIGWNILPVPKQLTQSDPNKQSILDYIEEHYLSHGPKSERHYKVKVLKSRSISEDEHQCFLNSFEASKITSHTSYPQIWDESARRMDLAGRIGCCELVSDTAAHDVWTVQGAINFATVPPKFLSRWHDTPCFANEVEWRLDDEKTLLADVLPEGNGKLARFITGVGFPDELRLFGKGLVYLAQHQNGIINLSHPQAEGIFTKWLELRGWTVELSPAGRIAKRMLQQLGRVNDTSILARKGILDLLWEINRGDEKKLAEQYVRGKIQQVENQQSIYSKIASEVLGEKILAQLIAARVFQLGMEIQCPICAQSSWYSVKEVDYELQCPKCLEELSFPSESKEVKWAYRALGPFSSSNQAHGAYTVLLTLRFFYQFTFFGSAITPLMSFTGKKDEMEIEADLALFFQESRFLDPKTELIFAECKTFNSFEEKDAKRMVNLGKQFPGAVLVFATLKETLSAEEKKLLSSMVNRYREDRKNKCPSNPIMILTGTELISENHFTLNWSNTGDTRAVFAQEINPDIGPRILFKFCDFTQQFYLDMDPWEQPSEEQSERTTSPIPF